MRYFQWIVVAVLVSVIGITVWSRAYTNAIFNSKVYSESISIKAGMTADDVLSSLVPGMTARERWVLFLFYPQFSHVQIGRYEFLIGTPILDALEKVHIGDVVLERFTIPEGLTALELINRVNQTSDLTGDPVTWSTSPLSLEFSHPEGAYLAETYIWRQEMTRFDFLMLTHQALLDSLDRAWSQANVKVKKLLDTPYNLLILASIVEKETAIAKERPRIAGVFINRLERGMRLQTDPTVIYGLGDRFNGDLTRDHLREKTAYNTYYIRGLPPTPIALVGPESLIAAARPIMSEELYFVADGTGGHAFSKTLDEHNANVRRYQLKR